MVRALPHTRRDPDPGPAPRRLSYFLGIFSSSSALSVANALTSKSTPQHCGHREQTRPRSSGTSHPRVCVCGGGVTAPSLFVSALPFSGFTTKPRFSRAVVTISRHQQRVPRAPRPPPSSCGVRPHIPHSVVCLRCDPACKLLTPPPTAGGGRCSQGQRVGAEGLRGPRAQRAAAVHLQPGQPGTGTQCWQRF